MAGEVGNAAGNRARQHAPAGTATVQRLERLAGTLEERGMCVTLVAPPSRVPRLQVAHPSPDGAIGDIYASRGRDGN